MTPRPVGPQLLFIRMLVIRWPNGGYDTFAAVAVSGVASRVL